jgi:quercetin dioxygenase-like cupin family protein
VRIEKGAVHSVRALGDSALVLSLSIPPLGRDDQHVVEE